MYPATKQLDLRLRKVLEEVELMRVLEKERKEAKARELR